MGWQVSVRSGTFTFCGATILDASTILCAAHCFYQSSASGKSIRAGSTQKSSGGQIRNIASIVWNTNAGQTYDSGTLDNDFVILKLESPLELNADVQPACLPSSAAYLDTSSTEERCFTSGWGTLSPGGSTPEGLKFVRVPAITNAACNNDYGGSITDSIIADKRATGISLASILSTNSWVSAADHGISDGTTIIIITSSIGDGWYSDKFETLRS